MFYVPCNKLSAAAQMLLLGVILGPESGLWN